MSKDIIEVYNEEPNNFSSFIISAAAISAGVAAGKAIYGFVQSNKERKRSAWDNAPGEEKHAMVDAAIHFDLGTYVIPMYIKSGKVDSLSNAQKRIFAYIKSKGVFKNGKGEDNKPDGNRFWQTTDKWANGRLTNELLGVSRAAKSETLGQRNGTEWLITEGWIDSPQTPSSKSTNKSSGSNKKGKLFGSKVSKLKYLESDDSFLKKHKTAIIITVVVVMLISASTIAYFKFYKK